MPDVAVLFADPRGSYCEVDGVDLWHEARDARKYTGPWPVVAHPPCARWSRLAGLVEALGYGRQGDDGGTFAAALRAVRAYGGVLEHPEHTRAWVKFDLPEPPLDGWALTFCGGWVARVDQAHYGHRANKKTWLYAARVEPPPLVWGPAADTGKRLAHNLGMRARSATPPDFRDLLLGIARSARVG